MKLRQMPIPEAALRDPDAVEMLRVWIAERGLHCSMKVGMYREITNIPEEKAWGKILADVARHMARALNVDQHNNSSASLEQIVANFMQELDAPTSELKGEFVKHH